MTNESHSSKLTADWTSGDAIHVTVPSLSLSSLAHVLFYTEQWLELNTYSAAPSTISSSLIDLLIPAEKLVTKTSNINFSAT